MNRFFEVPTSTCFQRDEIQHITHHSGRTSTRRRDVESLSCCKVHCLLSISICPSYETMSLEAARALLILPKDYESVRPHHLALAVGLWSLWTASPLYARLQRSIHQGLAKLSEYGESLVYLGILPDFLIRFGIRLQLEGNLVRLSQTSTHADKMKIVQELREMPIAIETTKANEQHYEVPARFYDLCLGPAKKYSCGYWPSRSTTFAESETAMLDLYIQRAQVKDGMKIVDLGCGWGSLSLHLARKFPKCEITGISNSHSQRESIMATAQKEGLKNLKIITVRGEGWSGRIGCRSLTHCRSATSPTIKALWISCATRTWS